MHITITTIREKGHRLQMYLLKTKILSVFTGTFLMMMYLSSPRQPINSKSFYTGSEQLSVNQLSQKKESMGKFELFRSEADKHYYFRLKAANGEVIIASQKYASKQSCMNGIQSVQTNGPLDDKYERVNGETRWSFNLKAANGEVIGQSQSYTSSGARENGIRSVKHNSVIAKIKDLTTD